MGKTNLCKFAQDLTEIEALKKIKDEFKFLTVKTVPKLGVGV